MSKKTTTRAIVITDLTRFSNPNIRCMAGTDLSTGECVRPMPYLSTKLCDSLGLLPGAILRGDFKRQSRLRGPHQEDANYTENKLSFEGPSSAEDFKNALHTGLFRSVEEGFEVKLGDGQKHLPLGHSVDRSIITLQVDPRSIEIVEGYKQGTTRIHFRDGDGRQFRYLSITDLGFHRYATAHSAASDLGRLNAFVRAQPEIYLRLGLGRAWNNGTIEGYWMQINGVYTFPDYFKDLRSQG